MSIRSSRLVASILMLLLTAPGAAAEKLRVGLLQFGTVSWELDVITHHGLFESSTHELEIVRLGSKNAVSVSLQAGAVDVIVSDWLWVSSERDSGKGYRFFPYSVALGALMTRPDQAVSTFADLDGKSMGVAGGPVDKSWLLLGAYSRKTTGTALTDLVEPSFAAPPLLNELMLRGDLDSVLNYWHYAAKLESAGMRTLITMEDVLAELGVEAPVAMIGWVFPESWAERNTEALHAFFDASMQAKKLLLESDREWQRIKPLTKVTDDEALATLRDAYRAGVPKSFGEAEIAASERVFEILRSEGGAELVGDATELNPGTFWTRYQIPRELFR